MSQFGEEDHIASVFDEIGDGTKVLADIGARFLYSNCIRLINERGFTGVLVDAVSDHCRELEKRFPTCKVINRCLMPWDVNEVIPSDVWFLSVDIDSNDFWVWANVMARPALVVVETNPLPGKFVARMRKEGLGLEKDGYGMSVEAAKWLGEAKGYDYIGRTEVNCFFVRKDLNCKYRLPDVKTHVGTPCGAKHNVLCDTNNY